MSPGGFDRRYALAVERFPQRGDAADPVAQVVLVGDFLEPTGDRFQVVAGQSAVRGEAFGEDEVLPASAGQFLLRRLAEFRKENFTDDETIIAIKRGNRS